jgi:hypothetical protein
VRLVGAQEGAGRVEEHDAAGAHQRDARAEQERFAHVVRDEDDGLVESLL